MQASQEVQVHTHRHQVLRMGAEEVNFDIHLSAEAGTGILNAFFGVNPDCNGASAGIGYTYKIEIT